MSKSERGSALPFIVLFVVLATTLVGGELRLARILSTRAQAQSAADAVALAAAIDGRSVAEEIAAANNAQIEALEISHDRSVARVRVANQWASAKAATSVDRRAPALRAVLATASGVLGEPVVPTAEGQDWIEIDQSMSLRLVNRSDVTGLCQVTANRWGVCR